MPNRMVLVVIAIIIMCTMLFGNKKVRVLPVLIKQLQVFRNAKTGKTSVWDIICFIFLPIILAIIILTIYIAMLIIRQKNKSSAKVYGTLLIIQGVLWSLVLGNNWTDSDTVYRVVYIVMILISFISGIQVLSKCK